MQDATSASSTSGNVWKILCESQTPHHGTSHHNVEAWIGQRVRAQIKTRRGGEYLVLAELSTINDEEVRLFSGKALATKAGSSEGTMPYPWASLVDVQPAKIR
jgi:hypothetical protein